MAVFRGQAPRRPPRGLYGLDAQVVPGTLRGYRAWRPSRDWRFLGLLNTELKSLMGNYVWHPDPEPASCRLDWWDDNGHLLRKVSHHSPYEGCSCGYYATYDASDYTSHVGFGTYIHGSVKAWGRISLGTIGFRAEYCQVEAVYGVSSRAAARRYGVPWFRTKDRMLAQFPPENVTELLR